MTVVAFALLAALSISTGISGRRIFAPCLKTNQFFCEDGHCVEKHRWCNGPNDCKDYSDERYCYSHNYNRCNEDIHFLCESRTKCIPREGYCDGYTSCPDGSDEKDCPCEELDEEEKSIEYEASIGEYRTQQKCWKITVGEGQEIDLTVSTQLYPRDCRMGNITVTYATDTYEDVFCPPSSLYSYYLTEDGRYISPGLEEPRSLKLTEDTLIRYRSNFYDFHELSKDSFTITYKKVDVMSKNATAIKCTEKSCISPEKKRDGNEDCQNGPDEQNCHYGAFSATYLEANSKKAVQWMQNQRDADWGWKENTAKAVVALHLAGEMNPNGSNKEDDLIAKQLELEVSTFLFRSKKELEKRSVAELSAYINGLLVICHDPRNFYGFDLISALKNELQTSVEQTPPFPYLTLCNAKEPVSEDAVNHLLRILQDSMDHRFALEIQALTIMALTCTINNNKQYVHLKQNISEALDGLKQEQVEEGSFGNEYTTALVLQALIANNQEKAKDWNPKSAIKFLTEKQEPDGSFNDFLTTYLVLPVLNVKSLLDVGKVNCTEDLKRPRDGGMISDIKNRLGGKTVVKYSLFIGDEKDQIHPIVLRVNENITILEFMMLAAEIDPKYKFKTYQIREKKYIYKISNIPNDPESNKFWFMYQGIGNSTEPILEQSPDKVEVHKKDHIIMWYKSLNFI